MEFRLLGTGSCLAASGTQKSEQWPHGRRTQKLEWENFPASPLGYLGVMKKAGDWVH